MAQERQQGTGSVHSQGDKELVGKKVGSKVRTLLSM